MLDVKAIQMEFDQVISYSQNIPYPKSDKLFELWLEAKRDIIEAFGGNLIYKVPEKVSFELSHKEKMLRVNDFIESVSMTWDNEPLASFIDDNKESFFNNIVEKGVVLGDNTKIPKGMKLVKAFKFFENDKKVLEELQNRASMLIQEDKIEGYLCFSVHPLDYLSSSENNYNWRSCHSLDGEYRSGNISYMTDKSTIVCYLVTDDRLHNLPNFPSQVKWNSKKWRMLLFLSDSWNAMYAGRQYPFFSDTALGLIREKAMEAFKMGGHWTHWHNDEIKHYDFEGDDEKRDTVIFDRLYVPIHRRLYAKNDLISDGLHSQHFNDLLRSSCYIPYYCWNRSHWTSVHFSIGAEAPCLRCGGSHISVTDDMLCTDCELEYGSSEDEMFITCDCCGRRILYDDAWFVESAGDYVCGQCADLECQTCDHCGDLYYKSEITYDRRNEDYRCHYCHSDRDKEDEEDSMSYWSDKI
jgi:hypothetical protein